MNNEPSWNCAPLRFSPGCPSREYRTHTTTIYKTRISIRWSTSRWREELGHAARSHRFCSEDSTRSVAQPVEEHGEDIDILVSFENEPEWRLFSPVAYNVWLLFAASHIRRFARFTCTLWGRRADGYQQSTLSIHLHPFRSFIYTVASLYLIVYSCIDTDGRCMYGSVSGTHWRNTYYVHNGNLRKCQGKELKGRIRDREKEAADERKAISRSNRKWSPKKNFG